MVCSHAAFKSWNELWVVQLDLEEREEESISTGRIGLLLLYLVFLLLL